MSTSTDSFLPSFDLTGRVAIVTGASSGIGARFGRVLHAAGADVVAGARRLPNLQSVAEELGDRFVPVRCDVTSDADCTALVDSAVDRFGRVDILVNCAGLATSVPAESESPDEFQRVVDVNLTGTFRVTHMVARHMLESERGGTIINVSSILGIVASGVIPQAGYAASKGAVISLTRELGAQWARRGIRVNALAPGWFPSEMTDELFSDERSVKWIQRSTPMGRAGMSHELDGALLFLASDASSFVTGQVLVVDGGWTAV